MRYIYLTLSFLALALTNWFALAAENVIGSDGPNTDPQYTQAVAAIEAENYVKAISLLKEYVGRVSDSADAYNYLGYASRKSGDLPNAFKYYDRALTLDPKHLSAHEYLGEAYLQSNNLAKAEEQLKILDGLCTFSCEQYRDLKAAVAAFKSK